MNAHLTRRDFTAALGGIVLSFTLAPRLALGQDKPRLPGGLDNNRMLDAWIRINADGTATVCTGKAELGQGIHTALWQMAAEELDLPLARVTLVSPDTGRTPDEGQTSGSQSIEGSGTALRMAGAEVRLILVELAAKRFGTGADTLSVSDGVISAPDGRKLGYGDLAAEVDLKREATGKIAPKKASEHKIVGKSVPRLDIPAKVSGGAAFVQDLRLPGMLHGRVVRPPRYGAKLEGLDDSAVKALPGVLAVVRDGNFLGVVAEREEQAIKARTALIGAARWSGGDPLPEPEKLHEHLLALPSESRVVSEKQAAVPDGFKLVKATYRKPYTAHAALSPACAVAEWKDGRLTVWSHTQGVFPLRVAIARALDIQPSTIRVIHAEASGCYGHDGSDDAGLDAALLARAVNGRPVRVQWMRDDEFMWEPYGPAMVMRAKAALLGDRIVDWDYEVWSNTHSMRPGGRDGVNLLASWHLANPKQPEPARFGGLPSGAGERNAVPTYEFPCQRIVNHLIKDMPVRVSALRTLGGYANVFAVESFMDELAAAAGADPIAFRLAHLKDARARAVIEAVAKAADWQPGAKGDGVRGRGFGFARYKTTATYNAVIVDIEVDRASGAIKVPRVWTSADAGQIINPDGLINQIEGGIIQSTSWTLHEEVRFDRNGITSRDWRSYPILSMTEAPKVETVLLNRPDSPPVGAGEASQGPAAAAIANAFTHATGKRLRDLPFTPARVKAALA
jgi:CO/xanthine dehydrogenase Mo-binding subunit